MDKSLAASKKLMQNYLSELLTEEEVEQPEVQIKEKQDEKLEKLLKNVAVTEPVDKPVVSRKSPPIVEQKIQEKAVVEDEVLVESKPIETRKSLSENFVNKEKSYRKESFQAMFFEVGGLTIAVPLIELGGIHNVDHINSLMGKPDWFKGVMLHREEKINVVDTAMWVMPEKCDETLKSSLNYQYIIMLSNSSWGLMAERLVDTVTLEQDDVKWLEQPSKRPWLAGLVKDRMCALLDVDSMIQLLSEGANIHNE